MKKEFKYEIKEHIGTVSSSPDGKYATEVNLISYNDAPATHIESCDKIMGSQNATPSITDSMGRTQHPTWNKETGQMYKGITLTDDEAETLGKILLGMKDNG